MWSTTMDLESATWEGAEHYASCPSGWGADGVSPKAWKNGGEIGGLRLKGEY